MERLRFAASLGLLAIALLFVLQNTERVAVDFLFWSFELRRAFLVLIILVIGFVAGWLSHASRALKRRKNAPPKA
ncbi:MAG: lipopolysaccharide assembly protein LapA domain-containing protein [Pseudomonadota bacterium]